MKLLKDLLIIETATTGPDPEKDSILHLSALLLDKDNLLEKAVFNEYVKSSFLEQILESHARLLGVEFEVLKTSKKIAEVLKRFAEKFDRPNFLFCTHNVQNWLFLRNAFRKNFLAFEYDPHIFELWTLGYMHALRVGMQKIPTLGTLLNQYQIKLSNQNNALEKAKAEAELLRKLIKTWE